MKNRAYMQILSPRDDLLLSDFQEIVMNFSNIVKSAPASHWGLTHPAKFKIPKDFSALNSTESNVFGEILHLDNQRFETLYWRGEKGAVEGSMIAARKISGGLEQTAHLDISLNFSKKPKIDELLSFFRLYCEELKADFAYIEQFSNQLVKRYDKGSTFVSYTGKKRTGDGYLHLTTFEIRHWLPDLCWLTFFGKPYVQLFGREKIETAPVYQIEKIGDGYLLQVSENIDDINVCYKSYREKIEEIKKHLNPDAFYTKAKAYGRSYFFDDVPEPGIVFDVPKFMDLDKAFGVG